MPRDAETFLIDVECYAGYRGEQTPRRFRLRGHEIEVAEIVDSWLAPGHRYFKVKDADGDLYVLRHDVPGDRWELTMFRRAGTSD